MRLSRVRKAQRQSAIGGWRRSSRGRRLSPRGSTSDGLREQSVLSPFRFRRGSERSNPTAQLLSLASTPAAWVRKNRQSPQTLRSDRRLRAAQRSRFGGVAQPPCDPRCLFPLHTSARPVPARRGKGYNEEDTNDTCRLFRELAVRSQTEHPLRAPLDVLFWVAHCPQDERCARENFPPASPQSTDRYILAPLDLHRPSGHRDSRRRSIALWRR